LEEVAPAAGRALSAAGPKPAGLDVFVPHQANLRMTGLTAERLGPGEDTVPAGDVIRAGTTSAASIPLALDALLAEGRVASGSTALLAGFGAGLNSPPRPSCCLTTPWPVAPERATGQECGLTHGATDMGFADGPRAPAFRRRVRRRSAPSGASSAAHSPW
jgi:hypothetical protein